MHLRDIIEKLQDQIDVNPLLYVCEQHTNDTFKLKNHLRTKEMRLITFEKQFGKYKNLKNDIEASLLDISSNLDTYSVNREIVNKSVRIFFQITKL